MPSTCLKSSLERSSKKRVEFEEWVAHDRQIKKAKVVNPANASCVKKK